MCLIYYRNDVEHSTTPIDWETLEAGFYSNPDGYGIIGWHIDRQEWVRKRSVGKSWEQCRALIEGCDAYCSSLLVHFRFGTQGPNNKANCHPFRLAPQTFLFHNGVYRAFQPTSKADNRSDTAILADHFRKVFRTVRKHADESSYSAAVAAMVAAVAGVNTDCRLAIALPNGAVEFSGKWHDKSDGWYSNTNAHGCTLGYSNGYGQTWKQRGSNIVGCVSDNRAKTKSNKRGNRRGNKAHATKQTKVLGNTNDNAGGAADDTGNRFLAESWNRTTRSTLPSSLVDIDWDAMDALVELPQRTLIDGWLYGCLTTGEAMRLLGYARDELTAEAMSAYSLGEITAKRYRTLTGSEVPEYLQQTHAAAEYARNAEALGLDV